MRSGFRHLLRLLVLVTILVQTSCKEDSGGEAVNVSSFIVIREALSSNSVASSNFYERQLSPTRESFTIEIDSTAQTEPVVVSYTLSGTAEIGKHIETMNLQGSVTIPAGSLSATVEYSILTNNFILGEQFNFTIRLNSVRGGNVRINSSYASFTNIIGISCRSKIPSGNYIEETENETVTIEETANNVFSISNLNFRYYAGPEYDEIPGEFVDQCGAISLQGTRVEETYGVAWIGTGEWNNEEQVLTLIVSDQTFNPDYKVEMTFRYSP